MGIEFKIDIEGITKDFQDFKKEIEADIQDSVKILASMVYTGISEKVQKNLHSTRKLYMDNLNAPVEIEPGVFVVSLNAAALFLEDGKAGGPMTGLLNSPKAKDGPNGRYMAIPFVHSKPPSQQTATAQQISQSIKSELKKRKIGLTGIEMDEKGQPKIGVLHQFTVKGNKLKEHHKNGPLEGINVIQRMGAGGKVERNVVSFRTISEANPWISPEMAPHHFFEDTLEEQIKIFNEQMLPEIMKNYTGFGNK